MPTRGCKRASSTAVSAAKSPCLTGGPCEREAPMSPPELRVFIPVDEAPAGPPLKELLADIRAEQPTVVAGEAANGLEVIERLPGCGAQLLLLDIQMPGMGGIELARHLGGLENAPAIVFVTAHDPHAVEAFELNALDYLMKPVRADRLAAALKKASAAGPVLRERLEQAGQQSHPGGR